jgi:hypothetical protein
MDRLYTKNGVPLQVSDDKVHSRSGTYVGRIVDGKVYDQNGAYVATIDGDRLVHRSSHNTRTVGATSSSNRGGIGAGHRGVSGMWGDEPQIPD